MEDVTFTATDETDGVKLTQTATINFTGPPATNAILDAFPASVAADGKSNAVITVTLKDSLGRPSPGKLVNISQGSGHSVITGPIPSVTNASGQVEFNAVDQVAETITYSAVDVTDGNLPFPNYRDRSFHWRARQRMRQLRSARRARIPGDALCHRFYRTKLFLW